MAKQCTPRRSDVHGYDTTIVMSLVHTIMASRCVPLSLRATLAAQNPKKRGASSVGPISSAIWKSTKRGIAAPIPSISTG